MVVAMVTVGTNNIQYNYTTWQVVEEYLPKQLLMDYRETFKCFDPRKTGVLRIEDVVLILREIGYKVTVRDLDHVLRNIIGADCRKTVSVVDFQEFIALMSVVVTNCIAEDEMHLVFRQFDVDGDGYITADELRNMLSRLGDDITDDELLKMIKAADMDGDGKVSYQEFVRVMTNSGGSSSDSYKCNSPTQSTERLSEKDENMENVFEDLPDLQKEPTRCCSAQNDQPTSTQYQQFEFRHVKHRRSWFSRLSLSKKSTNDKKKLEGRLSCPAFLNSPATEMFSGERRVEMEKTLSSSHGGSSFRLSGFRRKNKKLSR
ncbi:uncharacterized protein LOC120342666 [Styela clava]